MSQTLEKNRSRVKRDQIWQSEAIKAACRSEDNRRLTGPNARYNKAFKIVPTDDWSELLQKFVSARSILMADSAAARDLNAAYSSACEILNAASVSPDKSNLGFLFSDLWGALAKQYSRHNELFLSQWYSAMANLEPSLCDAIQEIDFNIEAANHLASFESSGNSANDAVVEIWQDRLRGFSLHALNMVRLELSDGGMTARSSAYLGWEQAVLDCQLAKDFSPLASYVRAKTLSISSGQIILAWLWALAQPQKNAYEAINGAIKKLRPAKSETVAHDSAWALCLALTEASDPKIPIHIRIEKLGLTAARIPSFPSIEYRAIAYLALMRALLRLKQYKFIPLCLSNYEMLSRSCSNNLTCDVFSFADDFRKFSRQAKNPSGVPTFAVIRLGKISVALFETGRILGSVRIAKLVRGDYKNLRLSEREGQLIAKLVGDCLADLRGPLAKLGQLIGHYLGITNHPLGKALSILHDSNTPVQFSDIEKLMEKEYGAPLCKIFRRIDPEPIGVGTVAQVHRATALDGKEIALKVKLPGIEQVFESDLKIFGLMSPVLKMLMPQIDFKALYFEIRKGLLKELDFEREIRMQERLSDMFAAETDIAIPKAFPDLSSSSIIASEYIDGLTFTRFAATATQIERDRMGEATVRFVVTSMLEGCFNSDPNPGNFLFARGKAYFIDYGCVQELTRDQRAASALLIRSILNQDLAAYKIAARMMGFVSDTKTFDYENTFKGLTSDRMGMWAQDKVHTIDMKKLVESFINTTGMRSKTEDTPTPRSRAAKTAAYTFPPQYFFCFREYFGHLLLLSALKARANWHQLVRSITDRHGLAYPEGPKQ